MNRLLRLIDRTSRASEMLAVVLLFGMCALMLAEVVARGFLSQSLPYSWEYSSYAMAAVFFLAAGRAVRTATHVRVSLLLELLPARLSRSLDLLANVVALAVVALIIAGLWSTWFKSFDRSLVSTSIMRTPLAVPQCLLLLGAVQWWLDLLARALRLMRGEAPGEFVPDGADIPDHPGSRA